MEIGTVKLEDIDRVGRTLLSDTSLVTPMPIVARSEGGAACLCRTGMSDPHNPSCSVAATRLSFSGLANEKSREIAMLSAPLARMFSQSSLSSCSLGEVRI